MRSGVLTGGEVDDDVLLGFAFEVNTNVSGKHRLTGQYAGYFQAFMVLLSQYKIVLGSYFITNLSPVHHSESSCHLTLYIHCNWKAS